MKSAIPPLSKPHNTALIFSGGGSRCGYYLGMYGALCELGKQPDIILATCGGSLIAGLLSSSPCPTQAKEQLLSRDFYQMFCRMQPNRDNKAHLISAIRRWLKNKKLYNKFHSKWLNNKPSSLLDNRIALPISLLTRLKQQALYEIRDESADNPMWQMNHSAQQFDKQDNLPVNPLANKQTDLSILTVSSQSVPIPPANQQTANKKTTRQQTDSRQTGFLWQQVLYCPHPTTRDYLNTLKPTASMSQYSAHIHPDIAINDDLSLAMATRSSINDMFYLPPIQCSHSDSTQSNTNHANSSVLMGGVIDLLPIELACQLAEHVYVEKKTPFDSWLAEPAIRAVFGFSANQRQQAWLNFSDDNTELHWIDTTDNAELLPPILGRKFKLLAGYIDIEYPTYDEFVQIMQAQYDYGYDRVMQGGS